MFKDEMSSCFTLNDLVIALKVYKELGPIREIIIFKRSVPKISVVLTEKKRIKIKSVLRNRPYYSETIFYQKK